MNNEIEKINNPVFNREGNIVIEEKYDGSGKTTTIKYGLIRLIGDKKEYRVSMRTLLDINKAKKANFTGQLNIPELDMSVNASQIVMMKSDIEEIRENGDFTKLPTESLCLDKDFNLITGSKATIEREHDMYYRATCHYVIRDGEKQYYIQPDQIQYLLTMVRDADPSYPHRVAKALRYGRDVHEISSQK